MSFLDSILQSEDEAKKATEKAEAQAKETLLHAQKKAQDELIQFEKELIADKQAQLENQQEELKQLHTSIVEEAKAEADKILENAAAHKKEAIELVLSRIR